MLRLKPHWMAVMVLTGQRRNFRSVSATSILLLLPTSVEAVAFPLPSLDHIVVETLEVSKVSLSVVHYCIPLDGCKGKHAITYSDKQIVGRGYSHGDYSVLEHKRICGIRHTHLCNLSY